MKEGGILQTQSSFIKKLQLQAFSSFYDFYCNPLFLCFFLEISRILFDDWPGAVMNRNYAFCLQKFGSNQCIVWSHRIVVSDWKDCIVNIKQFAKQLHISKESRVS